MILELERLFSQGRKRNQGQVVKLEWEPSAKQRIQSKAVSRLGCRRVTANGRTARDGRAAIGETSPPVLGRDKGSTHTLKMNPTSRAMDL
ncbi:hypothetical protein EVAR_58000_1 [Eumeta japonica]|uniref:Uncharacterized protein n=1 Tax=Eumeta variegata TaxID=151549 RepID=A0A4C1YBB0_EUMVA|nr:hypothetical protein EVAR_58000_1 [Eumeta japonica]